MAALERAALVFLSYNFNFDEYWVRRDDFNLTWAFNGGTVGDLRYTLFHDYYGLVAGEVEIIPDEPIEVYFVDPALVLPLIEWMVTYGYICDSGGEVVNFPEPGFSPCGDF
jgi:hypothetical protein